MAAALMTMTQCRKQETSPATPSADTIRMTVTAGPGRTDINTETGAITWSAGDKLYVSDGSEWLGSLTLVGDGGSAQGTFTGSIAGIDESETTCHFFYLGHDNGMEEPAAGTGDNVGISFAAQGGTLDGAMKYHLGHGTTAVTVTEGGYEGYVLMNTKIAMAHISFTIDGTQPYTGSLTMGGAGVSNEMTVSPDGAFTGSGTDGITIDNGDGITGERYVTLIPTGTADVFNVAFTGDAAGSMTFLAGIHENKFYGMKDAIAVTLEAAAPKFSVGENTTVEFAPGNLYWDGSAFRFEANQWDTQPTSDGEWVPNHVSHFKWSDKDNAVTDDYEFNDELFCASNFTVTGDSHTDWRTLSDAEWGYLLGTASPSRANATSLRKRKDFGGGVKGLVILPDRTDASVMDKIASTSDLAKYGAVFLPAAGYRDCTEMSNVGEDGRYWSSTPCGEFACFMGFYSSADVVYTSDDYRYNGFAVRLVR